MTKYKNMKSLAKIAVANSMIKEAEKVLTYSNEKSSNIFTLVKFKRKDRKDVEGGRCMRGKDVKFGFSEKDRKRIWKNYLEEIINKKSDWVHMTEASMVERPVEKIARQKLAIAMKAMKPRKAARPSEVSAEMICSS